ncbi:dipeptide ABC transporter ATP-binding protein [Cytobacillus depressus]|uniref:Dipeptide ABC transporter ATP-binding protein n=1 Tax=Cytobacillus depressus TaxID=1602942 RepID=A0A6L3VGF1_9BACI|nr:dipeptide ABC transporter ATP-binding protein [Cytobacillus depressus]KAB2338604.1 dipeptide ABC transporter ATP-binding protein [Cytobacillus depressus]
MSIQLLESRKNGEIKDKDPLLELKNLKKFFPVKKSLLNFNKEQTFVQAVNDVSFTLFKGETYGLVGESGCGKSTTGRTLLKLTNPTEGQALYNGKDIFKISNQELRKVRQDIQMVFQDPYSSLNPRKRIGNTLEEPLVIHNIGSAKERTEIVMEILSTVGLQLEHYYRYPHEFSGGQRQRIGLARALILNPKILIMDEPVSALDVSIQSQILNLLKKIQSELNLSYLFISHDMSVVRHISDRIGVMYLGKLVEEAPTDVLFAEPLHPYTKALLSAVPVPNLETKRERIILKGDLPSPMNPPSGCVFHTRCPFAEERCKIEIPQKKMITNEHNVACHLYDK